jgi:hypothetical protein
LLRALAAGLPGTLDEGVELEHLEGFVFLVTPKVWWLIRRPRAQMRRHLAWCAVDMAMLTANAAITQRDPSRRCPAQGTDLGGASRRTGLIATWWRQACFTALR